MSTVNSTTYLFEADGKLYRHDLTRREIAITPEMVSSLCPSVEVRAPRLVDHPKWGMTGLLIESGENYCWWTVRLNRLMLRCRYKVIEGGIMFPQLDAGDSNPNLSLEWTPPKDMRLVFLMCTQPLDRRTCIKNGSAHLFAFSGDGNTWRLPLGNIYDDCHLCLGTEEFLDETHMGVLSKTLTQFENSNWNQDLWGEIDKIRNTQALFRFKAVNDGNTQIPTEKHWTQFCYKVSVGISTRVVL